MSENDNIIVDMSTRIFQDLCDPQAINSGKTTRGKSLYGRHWKRRLTAGFVSEELEVCESRSPMPLKFSAWPANLLFRRHWPRRCWPVGLSQGEIGFPVVASRWRPSEKRTGYIDNNNTLTGTARSTRLRGSDLWWSRGVATRLSSPDGLVRLPPLSLADDAKDVDARWCCRQRSRACADEFNEDALFMMEHCAGARWRARLKPC